MFGGSALDQNSQRGKPVQKDSEDGVVAILKELADLPGPSGREDAVMDALEARWRALGTVERRPVGNLMLSLAPTGRCGGDTPLRVVLLAHADERSYQVKSIDKEGFLRIIGGHGDRLDWPFFVAQQVRVLTTEGELPGLLATTTGHVMIEEQKRKKALDWGDIFVDIGAKSAEEARAWGVEVGSRIVWNTRLTQMGHHLYGKALDDRAGLAIITQALKEVDRDKLCYQVTIAASVQEEIGLVGGWSVGDVSRFDLGLIVDNGLTGDIPTVQLEDMPVTLGGGPIIVHRDSSTHYHRGLVQHLIQLADARKIPIQHALFYHYGSDGASLTKQGLPTAMVAPPVRYSHSPVEAACEGDLVGAVALIKAFLETPPPTIRGLNG